MKHAKLNVLLVTILFISCSITENEIGSKSLNQDKNTNISIDDEKLDNNSGFSETKNTDDDIIDPLEGYDKPIKLVKPTPINTDSLELLGFKYYKLKLYLINEDGSKTKTNKFLILGLPHNPFNYSMSLSFDEEFKVEMAWLVKKFMSTENKQIGIGFLKENLISNSFFSNLVLNDILEFRTNANIEELSSRVEFAFAMTCSDTMGNRYQINI